MSSEDDRRHSETFPHGGESPDIDERAAVRLPADTMVDHFRVMRLIGVGGMGEVYLARDTQLGRRVALKVINTRWVTQPGALEAFRREARTTAQFGHPNIVMLYAAGEYAGRPYLALEYIEGQSLAARITERHPSLPESLRIMLSVCQALAEAHLHGVLHLDLKPANIVIDRNGRVRVVDFGVATTIKAELQASASDTASWDKKWGTPEYMAPEQWRHHRCTPATDIWALGVILFELCAQQLPYGQQPVSALRAAVCSKHSCPSLESIAGVPRDLVSLVSRCLKKDEAERPSAQEVGRELERLVGSGRSPRVGEGSPFRGLMPFGLEHAGLFFGRDDEVDAFVERLRHHPILPVVGPTGAGKSSFVQAGVIPRLREQENWTVLELRPGERPFHALADRLRRRETQSFGRTGELSSDPSQDGSVASVNPSRSNGSVASVNPSQSDGSVASVNPSQSDGSVASVNPSQSDGSVASVNPSQSDGSVASVNPSQSDGSVASVNDSGDVAAPTTPRTDCNIDADGLLADPLRLPAALRSIAKDEESKVLLVVDQLEELFTMVGEPEVRRRFLSALFSAADDPLDPVRVVVTVRDDFLGRLSVGPEARDALTQVTVIQSLSEQALRDTMRRPVEAVGYRYDDSELVHEMTSAVVGEVGCLPLLQFVGQMLWERRDRKRRLLLRSAYEDVGGVEGALARHADGTVDGLSAPDVEVARNILVRLVSPERTRKVVARETLLDPLGEAADEVLSRLTEARLVSVTRLRGGASDGPLLELAHESLIRTWGTLARWLDEGREELAFVAEATVAAQLWHKRGRRPAELWQGDALADASRMTARLTADLPAVVTEFLRASLARDARRRGWRRAAVMAGGGVLSIIAASAISVALVISDKEREARQQRNEARAQRAVAQSERETTRLEHARGLREGARAAVTQGSLLEARSKLRLSLEQEDAAAARALWWNLRTEPALWKAEIGAFGVAVAYSRDGSTIAAGCQDGAICLFDADSRGVRVLGGDREKVIALAFSCDGHRLAGGDWKGEVVIWDVASGAATRVLAGQHRDRVEAVAFSPDGALLASAGRDRVIQLWSLESGRAAAALHGHSGGIRGVEFSPDGRVLVSAGEDPSIRLWDVRSGELVRELVGHTNAVEDVAFSPDGAAIASAGVEGVVRLWDPSSGEQTAVLRGHTEGVRGLAYRPDGKKLASSSYDKTIRIWDLPTGELERELRGHTASVRDLSYSPDGRRLASTSYDQTVRLWAPAVEQRRTTEEGHAGPVRGIAFSPDGQRVASGGFDGTVRLWNTQTGEQSAVLADRGGGVYGVAFSPDGTAVAASSTSGAARVWDVATGKPTATLRGHSASVYAVEFSPDGRQLVTGSRDGDIRRWDLEAGETRAVMSGHEQLIWDLAYGPNAQRIASASWDWSVRIWDAHSGALLRRLAGHEAIVYGVSFSPDGQFLASSSADRTVRLWDLERGTGRVLARPGGRVNVLSFDPAGRRVVGPMSDGTTRVWDLDGNELLRMGGHSKQATAAEFSPDGELVASAGDDGTVRVWDATDGRPYWRAPVLLHSPPRLLTHLGWTSMGGEPVRVRQTEWRDVLERQARYAEQDGQGRMLCVQTHSGTAQLWDLQTHERVSVAPLSGVRTIRASRGGCVVARDMDVRLLTPRSDARGDLLVDGPPSAIGRGPSSILVAQGGSVSMFDDRGKLQRRLEVGEGVSALGAGDDVVVVGYRSGLVRAFWASGDRAPTDAFEAVPADRVTRILAGPMGTAIVGWADGTLGIWGVADGTRLLHGRLHGPVVHLRLEDQTLYAATDLGRFDVWDLSVFYEDYCDLLARVWAQVRTVWQAGRPIPRPAPTDHRCHRA